MKPVSFPKDEKVHPHTIEWWYFNGHLKDKKNNKYAFMNCLFKVNLKKIKLPLLKKSPVDNLYFSHSLISDIKRKKFYPKLDYLVLVSKDSFSKPLLFVNYASPLVLKGYFNSSIEEPKKDFYKLKTEDVALDMFSTKKPLLLGGDGYVKLKSKKTYYYSLTNLKTKGILKINNKPVKVTGKVWMDHQWADVKYPEDIDDKWTWFSIQLDNQTEIVCFEYDEGGEKNYLASISYPNNKQEHTKEVKITPIEKAWVSPKTKRGYRLSWKIEIPSKGIVLKVKPFIKQQEMNFGTINYWEGPLKVEGLFKNKKVNGLGFLEVVGRPFQLGSLKFLALSGIDIFQQVYYETKKVVKSII